MTKTFAITALIVGLGLAAPAFAEGDDPRPELAELAIESTETAGAVRYSEDDNFGPELAELSIELVQGRSAGLGGDYYGGDD